MQHKFYWLLYANEPCHDVSACVPNRWYFSTWDLFVVLLKSSEWYLESYSSTTLKRFVFRDRSPERLEVFLKIIFLCFVWPLGCFSEHFSQYIWEVGFFLLLLASCFFLLSFGVVWGLFWRRESLFQTSVAKHIMVFHPQQVFLWRLLSLINTKLRTSKTIIKGA